MPRNTWQRHRKGKKRWDTPGERWGGWPWTEILGRWPMVPASKQAQISKWVKLVNRVTYDGGKDNR